MLNAVKARDDLGEILQKQEYQVYYNHSKGVIATWWEKTKEWIASQLEKLFPSIQSASGASSAILLTIIVIVILLLGAAAFILIRNTRRNRLVRNQKPLQSKERNWTYIRHLEEAGKLESLDDYTESTRHLFLAMLLYFHEREWLEARIWKTNWDYYDEIRKVSQQTAEEFYELAHFFEDAAYGERKVSPEEYKPFRTKIRDILGSRGVESIQ
ncbi:DUF4129 domain-containing protein [Neobacillus drentensis]|uniref:DUF4129 domain-containing protein n=1 Tax=Neobacillus drentensis TaxID=220684 RepID=UPI002FFFAC20